MLEFDFGHDPRTDRLASIHAALIAAFGRIERPDERRKDPVWTLVQGVIGAQTKTPISNASTDALRAVFGTWQGVADAELPEIERVLANQTLSLIHI